MPSKWTQIMIRWNDVANRAGLSRAVTFSRVRQRLFESRAKDFDGILDDWFQEVLDACLQLDDFNLGLDPASTWRGVDIDYALSSAGAVKLIEGRCARRGGGPGGEAEPIDPSLSME